MSISVLRWIASVELGLAFLLALLGASMFPEASLGAMALLSAPLIIVSCGLALASYVEMSRTAGSLVLTMFTVGICCASEYKWWLAKCWFMDAVQRTSWSARLAMSLTEYCVGALFVVLIMEYKHLPPQPNYVPGQLR